MRRLRSPTRSAVARCTARVTARALAGSVVKRSLKLRINKIHYDSYYDIVSPAEIVYWKIESLVIAKIIALSKV